MDTADTTTKSLHTNSTSDSMRHSTDTEPRHRQSIGGASSTPHDAWRAASAQRENLSVLEEDMYMTDGTVSRVPIGLQLMGKPVEVQWKNFHLRPSVNKDALTSRQEYV
ncbi:hypothetical protein SARC_11611 [Sphaeroforma arctica JP610]|uniref:Uncharacterized protein n=1 Tax=Sphaeroforma arctica JP610 TaxID=667725 RepID=A0A0L0FGG3_9EUKA|nr:hypothetical protein SARC_11611 [Sphaeroforma arctica JP610]KNC75872.1 hypothetical protein SARC_11611 [Sphaeroforma arctica JP610]|eukprot:XP_014149774.1 hypothetical protein SARC_11611 [Sphaeroforma arctica JP610]